MLNPRRTCMVVGTTPHGVTIMGRLLHLGIPAIFVGRRKAPAITQFRFEGWGRAGSFRVYPLSDIDASLVNLLIFAVHPFDLEGCFSRYLPYIPAGVPVIPVSPGATENVIRAGAKKFPQFLWRFGACLFDSRHISSGIFELVTRGKMVWGPLATMRSNDPPWVSGIETTILQADRGQFFATENVILPLLHRKWLFEVVTGSLAVVRNLANYRMLLDDLNELRSVFNEAFDLGAEMWGNWDASREQVFSDMLSAISRLGPVEPSMVRTMREGDRSLNSFLARVATQFRGFDRLVALSREIDSRSAPDER